jgi:hypothetical protein
VHGSCIGWHPVIVGHLDVGDHINGHSAVSLLRVAKKSIWLLPSAG